MSYMYGIYCVPLVKNTFFKSPPLPKKCSDCESHQKSGLGFYGFMIRFWICPKKSRQNTFLDSEIRIWIFPKKPTPSWNCPVINRRADRSHLYQLCNSIPVNLDVWFLIGQASHFITISLNMAKQWSLLCSLSFDFPRFSCGHRRVFRRQPGGI